MFRQFLANLAPIRTHSHPTCLPIHVFVPTNSCIWLYSTYTTYWGLGAGDEDFGVNIIYDAGGWILQLYWGCYEATPDSLKDFHILTTENTQATNNDPPHTPLALGTSSHRPSSKYLNKPCTWSYSIS